LATAMLPASSVPAAPLGGTGVLLL
jgi:hypothetical protein